ncbi:alpha amylase C-terminal domain-containing protein [uncultured Duncaniella sp.]|uniref:alpha amylase C-terminal domain-containing protein n=1 Tax=uncultured Duncaniella sp. TaxID=2768039 RepID=UPI0026F1AB80|nr:alpha amylase C-terminal domain-containing protein [uncultured Duncaniella sp.]
MMNLKFIENDSYLEPFRYTIEQRYRNFILREVGFTENRRKLSEAFNSYLYYGMHHTEEGWIFREWAPHAMAIYLIGDFSEWQKREEFRLKPLEYGNWEICMPLERLKHGMKYRLLIEWEGGCGERIPSHVRRVVQNEETKAFDAQVWFPEAYKWENTYRKALKNPLIYEAHVGMSTEEKRVSTFEEFRTQVLPRIADLGYNTVQLMGIQEHPYYGSFGYQVSSFFAVSSRLGTPEDLKRLIDDAHGRGIAVVMDLVHSHAVKNELEGLSCFDGTYDQYFYPGERGNHNLWNSRCFDYGKNEVLNFLLSNCKYWLEEFRFDGFRFDGITSMLYWDHGLGRDFTEYKFYYDGNQNEDAIIYLTLANRLIHEVNENAVTIAEDMSGMPGLAVPIDEGGIGFDFRLSMGIPDYWIKLVKEKRDEDWHVGDLFYELTNKRQDEHTISYAESHDQAMVGDKTLIFRMVDKEMYTSMNVFERNMTVDRGMALHKMIRLLTIMTAGDGYLNFLGNEWGHPEWIDFPREGNGWSYEHARRLWHLVDDTNLRYRYLNAFDRDMIRLVKKQDIFRFRPEPMVRDNEQQVLIFSRGGLLLAFNFNPSQSFSDYRFGAAPGKYVEVLNTDSKVYDGFERIREPVPHFTLYDESSGYNELSLYLPSRSALVLKYDD